MKILLSIALTLSLATAASSAPEARLVFDLGHGQASGITQMPALGTKLGYKLDEIAAPLSADSLRHARLLYLRVPTKAYAEEEKRAIVEFVRRGGSLLVVMDESRRVDLELTGLNDVIAPFGMKLTADTDYLHNCGALAKAGRINSTDRELPFSGGRAVDGGTAFAWQLDQDGKPAQPFAAYVEIGAARVIVMSDAMASLFMGKPEGVRLTGVPRDATKTVYWGKDAAPFMDEVIAWLIAR